jgi:hypothetical protein
VLEVEKQVAAIDGVPHQIELAASTHTTLHTQNKGGKEGNSGFPIVLLNGIDVHQKRPYHYG